jgi:hypothetical protein
MGWQITQFPRTGSSMIALPRSGTPGGSVSGCGIAPSST